MKKYIKYLVIIAIIIISIAILKNIIQMTYISELNRNIEIDNLQLLTPIENSKEIDNPNYYEIGGFGGRFFHQVNDEYYIVYGGYPDVLDKLKLTNIRLQAGDYSIYGLKIGSDIIDVENIMKSHGYKSRIEGPYYYYNKGNISIVFYTNNDMVLSFSIELISTNKKDVVF